MAAGADRNGPCGGEFLHADKRSVCPRRRLDSRVQHLELSGTRWIHRGVRRWDSELLVRAMSNALARQAGYPASDAGQKRRRFAAISIEGLGMHPRM